MTFFAIVMPFLPLSAQYEVKWLAPAQDYHDEHASRWYLRAENCFIDEHNGLPVLFVDLEGFNANHPEVNLIEPRFIALDSIEQLAVIQSGADKLEIGVKALPFHAREASGIRVYINPIRKNASGQLEKLVSFELSVEPGREIENIQHQHYAGVSVLNSGPWFKMAIPETGIYKVTYEDLKNMGLNVQGSSSSAIRIFGYGGGMLPEKAGLPRHDDLPEVAIHVADGGDGVFNPGDYLLFYAQGPLAWKYNADDDRFDHQVHYYSDYSWYFITLLPSGGLRIPTFPQPQGSATRIVNTYNWYDVYNPREMNLIWSGKYWVGDVFDLLTKRDYTFRPFSRSEAEPVSIRLSALARSTAAVSFDLTVAGQTNTLFLPKIIIGPDYQYANISTQRFNYEFSGNFSGATLRFNKSLNSSTGWLNYIEVNAVANLEFKGGQLAFRRSNVQGGIVEYHISGNASMDQIWDVTDPLRPGKIEPLTSGGSRIFKALSDTLREYIVADAQGYLKPALTEKVENQNLHGLTAHDMVMVVHPLFMEQAQRLADFHVNHNDLSVLIVQPQQIYNEFSSGAQDISAIRDFMRMLWKEAPAGKTPRFLLLFGDASYDYKDILAGNTNFVPTFQSRESLHPVSTYATDDFFGCIDDNEGGLTTDIMDIGVGRLVVTTPEEAKMAVDKIIHYTTDNETMHGDWRNVIAFVADDEDYNDHMMQANNLATMIDTTYPNYNIDKIFLDAYPQVSTPGGQRIPAAKEAINQRVSKGALIVNYTGHGGETSWAEEKVLEVADINSWTNYNRLPVFMTATCEFSRYDDPARVSAGELIFLNPKGGGIALFTTARPTLGNPNYNLTRNFYNIALQATPGQAPFLGDLIRISKQMTGPGVNVKKFVLLGDPAMKMAYPTYSVETVAINGVDIIPGVADTLKALQSVTISGRITNADRQLLSDFNGMVYPTIFDKETSVTTLGGGAFNPMVFSIRKNIIYKGNVKVVNGEFSFTFIVPRDIAYNFGAGKISYYASDGKRDAAGYFKQIIVGGMSKDVLNDTHGPEIELYLNNEKFRSGGFTDENPVLLAKLKDESGINTVGNSIGHDIVAVLDGKSNYPFVLNEYYQTDVDTYQRGSVRYPMFKLAAGPHELTLKVWDINNNSAEKSIQFVVVPSREIELGQLLVYPNPSSGSFTVEIEHNQSEVELQARVDLFSLSGVNVISLKQHVFANGYRNNVIVWNGISATGQTLDPGFYIGKVSITNPSGDTASKSFKLLVTR
ncbi:MAG: type IX secretion system sortase PorU [Lentimicrobium sp.]|nr:type IX secretion system sortase PorU [Lentimicrobium sp.]